MCQLYDFEKNVVFYGSPRTFEIVKLTRLYGLKKNIGIDGLVVSFDRAWRFVPF